MNLYYIVIVTTKISPNEGDNIQRPRSNLVRDVAACTK